MVMVLAGYDLLIAATPNDLGLTVIGCWDIETFRPTHFFIMALTLIPFFSMCY
jgi:hypothetical protein